MSNKIKIPDFFDHTPEEIRDLLERTLFDNSTFQAENTELNEIVNAIEKVTNERGSVWADHVLIAEIKKMIVNYNIGKTKDND